MSKVFYLVLLFCNAILFSGCDVNLGGSSVSGISTNVTTDSSSKQNTEVGTKTNSQAGTVTTNTDETQSPPVSKPQEGRKAADVGDGKKGHYGKMSVFDHSIGTLFRAKEQIAFRLQIPDAINKYKAFDPDGKGPKSHEEFMTGIIQAYHIPLPELKEGCRYEYDPATETLMVVYPIE